MEAVDAPVTWFNKGVGGDVGVSVYMACTFCAGIVRQTANIDERQHGELMKDQHEYRLS